MEKLSIYEKCRKHVLGNIFLIHTYINIHSGEQPFQKIFLCKITKRMLTKKQPDMYISHNTQKYNRINFFEIIKSCDW